MANDYTPTSLTGAVVAKALMDFGNAAGAISKRAGYTYINGALIPNAISPIVARAIRAGRVIREGIGKTEKFTANIDPAKVNSVTVQMQTNTGIHSRTLRSAKPGTPGNDGIININRKIIPSTYPMEIPTLELDDQPFFFPRMALETMAFDEVAMTLENRLENITNNMDGYDMARMVAFAAYRSEQGADNMIKLNTANVYDDNYMVKIIAQLDAAMSNGDKWSNVSAFRGRRELALRNELLGYLISKGAFVLNTPQSNQRFWEPQFDLNEGISEGSQYRGGIRGYDMYEWNDSHQAIMEQYLGLEEGALNGLLGIISTPMSYAGAGVAKKEMKLLQSTEYDGVVSFPFIKWGGNAFRTIFLIVDETFVMPTALKSSVAPAPVMSPERWQSGDREPLTRPVYDEDGNVTGHETVMDVLKPNGDTSCNVIIKLTNATGGAAITNATFTTTVNGETSTAFTNNGNGTYSILVPKGQAASIAVSATGFTGTTISVTAKQSDRWQFETSKTLTATA